MMLFWLTGLSLALLAGCTAPALETSSKAARNSAATIDRICRQLEPLGDTPRPVGNRQSRAASHGNDRQILSRNCQPGPGDRAFLQQDRLADVRSPGSRAQRKASRTAQ